MSTRESEYSGFIEARRVDLERLSTLANNLQFVFFGTIAIILLGLKSPIAVWVYLVLLCSVAAVGIRQLRNTVARTEEAIEHLKAVAAKLPKLNERFALLAYLEDQVTPSDKSNVPEALVRFAKSRFSTEDVRATAIGAFGYATSALSFASFLRSALVLAGLFGTVLFFAFQLGTTALAGSDFAALSADLRGALASTLGGILGSLILGLLVHKVAIHIDDIVLETEAFLSGPLHIVLGKVASQEDAESETDMWQALQRDVGEMTRRTAGAYEKLVEEVHQYGLALEGVSKQLAGLPQVRVPPELATLEETISRFEHATIVMSEIVPALVRCVEGAVAVFPQSTVAAIEDVKKEAQTRSHRLTKQLEGIAGQARAMQQPIMATQAAVGQLSNTLPPRMANAEKQLGAIAGTVGQVKREVSAAREQLDAALEPMETLQSAAESAGKAADKLTQAATSLSETMGRFDNAKETLEQLPKELSKISRITRWHDRASRAPLMRLLLLQMWPTGRWPFMWRR